MLCHAPNVPSSLGPSPLAPCACRLHTPRHPNRLQLDLSHLGPDDAVYPVWSTCTHWLALDLTVPYGYGPYYLTAQVMTETDLGGVERGAEYLCRVMQVHYATRYLLSYSC